jgi:hypothetical protein
LGPGELGDQFGDGARREELAGLLAGVRREALDQEDVGLADRVLAHVAQVEGGLREILEQVAQPSVPVPRLAEIGLGIEADVAENAFQLRVVRLLDRLHDLVDQLPDVIAVAPFVEAVEIAEKGFDDGAVLVAQLELLQLEPLPIEPAADAQIADLGRIALVFRDELLVVLAPDVADVFEEQESEDVLVLGRVDRQRAVGGLCRSLGLRARLYDRLKMAETRLTNYYLDRSFAQLR